MSKILLKNRSRRVIASALTVLFAFSSCKPAKQRTLAKLNYEPIKVEQNYPYQLLNFSGQFCANPLRDQTFETRFLFVIDNSGSCYPDPNDSSIPPTDPDGKRRYQALLNFVDSIKANPKYGDSSKLKFGLNVFNHRQLFCRTEDPVNPPISCQIGKMDRSKSYGASTSFVDIDTFKNIVNGDYTRLQASAPEQDYKSAGWTDYGEALTEAYTMIKSDIAEIKKNLQEGEEPASKPFYMVVFISDGAPTDPNGNTIPYAQIAKVQKDIQNYVNVVESQYTLGVQMNTVLFHYSAATLAQLTDASCSQPVIPELGKCPEALLKQMAQNGGGAFFKTFGDDPIPYDKFTIPTQKLKTSLVDYFLYNASTVWDGDKLFRSPANDGLTEDDKTPFGADPTLRDANGNGLADIVELYLGASGVASCIAKRGSVANPDIDDDNDGLTNLEETCLLSDPKNPDTNGDTIDDGTAIRLNLGYKVGDNSAWLDSDRDGLTNIYEIKKWTPPFFDNNKITNLKTQDHTVTELGMMNNQLCYKIDVRQVPYFDPCDEIQLLTIEMESSQSAKRTMKKRVYRAKEFLNLNVSCP